LWWQDFQYHFFQNNFFCKGRLLQVLRQQLFAGAGVGWNNLRVDVSGSYHPQLGFSPGIFDDCVLRQ